MQTSEIEKGRGTFQILQLVPVDEQALVEVEQNGVDVLSQRSEELDGGRQVATRLVLQARVDANLLLQGNNTTLTVTKQSSDESYYEEPYAM